MTNTGFCLQGCASSPNDSQQQQILKSAAEELRSATNTAASNALKRRLIGRLEVGCHGHSPAALECIGFFLACEDFWRMFDSSFPACAFFIFYILY